MKKIKISLIGAGKTMEDYLKVLSSYKNQITLEGIFSRTPDKARLLKKKYKIKYLCKNIDDLYLKTNADIVFIIISVENTKKVCLQASKYPWKCYVEKPFGLNYKETLELSKKLKNKIENFYIAFNRDYYQSVIECDKFLKKDNSKRIITITDQQNYKNFRKYINNKKFLKNLKFSNSIHLFVLAKHFARKKFNKITTIYKYKKKFTKYIVEKIQFTSGDIVFFHSIWNRPGPWKIEISTDKYFATLQPLEELSIKDKNNKNIYIKPFKYDNKFKPGISLMVKEFLKLYKNKKAYNVSHSNILMRMVNETKL
jgi:predicted dehydrogenase